MPAVVLNPNDNPWAIVVGPDHNVWFTGRTSNIIGVVVNGRPTEFTIPTTASYPNDLAFGPDGNLWSTESNANGIGRFNPATGQFLPRIVLASEDFPTTIIAGPDGNMWFTNPSNTRSANMIGVVLLH